jgi:hypothetical protein
MILGGGKSLVGGLAIPGEGLRIVLGDPQAVFVHVAEVILGRGIALIGGLAEPVQGLRVILVDVLAEEIPFSQLGLGRSIARVGSLLEGGEGEFCEIFRLLGSRGEDAEAQGKAPREMVADGSDRSPLTQLLAVAVRIRRLRGDAVQGTRRRVSFQGDSAGVDG